MAGPRHFIDYFTLLPPPDAKKKDTFILGFVVFALTLRNDTCTNVEKVHYSLQERVVLLQAMLSICVSNRVQHSLEHSPYHATLYIYMFKKIYCSYYYIVRGTDLQDGSGMNNEAC